MIGNDIIDLRAAARESNWRRRGYLDKVFTPAEQEQVHTAPDADIMVWLLWSCKEAAYKIVHRATLRREYAPLKFIVHVDGFSGKIIYGGEVFYFNTMITGDCLHTVAAVEEGLLEGGRVLSYRLHDPGIAAIEKMIVKDVHGVPSVWDAILNKKVPVSISHHGDYWGMVK